MGQDAALWGGLVQKASRMIMPTVWGMVGGGPQMCVGGGEEDQARSAVGLILYDSRQRIKQTGGA